MDDGNFLFFIVDVVNVFGDKNFLLVYTQKISHIKSKKKNINKQKTITKVNQKKINKNKKNKKKVRDTSLLILL